ncbi:MAG: reverse transcriptase family protein, partial [Acidiferrobacter sp.]
MAQLAIALGVDVGILQLISGPEARSNYRRHSIPKRNRRRKGEVRVVFEPASEELKQVHKTIARRLALYASQADPTFPAPCSLGYRRKKSTKDNAKPHCGAVRLLRADIRDFFPTVSKARVEGLFVRLRIPQLASATLARILCLEDHLTLGLSASPLVANLACHGLDARLDALARRYNATYTRYADDISISGTSLPDRAEIALEVESEGFVLSEKKFRITKPGQAHYVTGLSVSDPDGPHVPREMKRNLRQELYYCRKFGIEEHLVRRKQTVRTGVNRLDGTVSYVSFIEHDTSHDHRAVWEALLARDDVSPTLSPRHDRPSTPQHCAIDETIISVGSIRCMAIGWALFSERKKVEDALERVLADYLVSGRKRKTLGKRRLFCGKRQPKKCGVGYHIGDEWQRSVRP